MWIPQFFFYHLKHFLKSLQSITAITELRFHFRHLQEPVYFLFSIICFGFRLIFHYAAICSYYTSQVYWTSVTLDTSFSGHLLALSHELSPIWENHFCQFKFFPITQKQPYSIFTFRLRNFFELLQSSLNPCYSDTYMYIYICIIYIHNE